MAGRQRLPTADRVTIGSFWQFVTFTKRSLVQQTRHIGGLVFDLGICWLAGSFLGLIYLKTSYEGPLPPSVIATCPGPLKELCRLPQFDPIVGQASLTCLALSLAGVASSLRVFGAEKVVFRRETSTGTSSEVRTVACRVLHCFLW